jgi:hypothetical protein
MHKHSSFHLDVLFLLAFGVWCSSELLVIGKFKFAAKVCAILHDGLHNYRIYSGQSVQVCSEDRTASPLLASSALLSEDFELDPQERLPTSRLCFEVEAEEDQSIVAGPLPLPVLVVVLNELWAPVVFALESQLDNSSDIVDVGACLLKEELLLAVVDGKAVAFFVKTVQPLDYLGVAVLGGAAVFVSGHLGRFGQLVVEVPQLFF